VRYEPCPACGRPTAVSKRYGLMREHTRVQYIGLITATVRCRGSGTRFEPEDPR
jgi:hypothetical protein